MSKKLKLALSIAFVVIVGAIATTEVLADGGPNPPCFPCGPSGN